MIIRNKTQFFQLWKEGVLGNRTRLWEDEREAYASNAPMIGFREVGKAGGGAWCGASHDKVLETASEWRKAGRKFIMDDFVPNEKQTLIGEVCRTHLGLRGEMGVTKLPMRPAKAAGLLLHRTGATILNLFDRYMDPSSRDDLNDLFDLYPDSAIEFACFSVNVGVFPHRNTMFWEVRNY